MITKAIISQTLDQHFKHCFHPDISDEDLPKILNQIADTIFKAVPVPVDSKWLLFTGGYDSPSGKTKIYQVRSKETPHFLLGEIKWYPAFRCYSFFASSNTIFETQCLQDIANFIDVLMHLHYKKQ